ncbi:MAG: clostripain-related cysteine peptidase [Elusimicrobia bacterium]|nr:clostripain-related cysteine peptidase [Elusimicrobiota bacterium]
MTNLKKLALLIALSFFFANTHAYEGIALNSPNLREIIKLSQSDTGIDTLSIKETKESPSIRKDYRLPALCMSSQTNTSCNHDSVVPTDWLIAVYMNGKSNIEPFALNDMNRFESIGSSNKVKIVVELGRSKGTDNDTTADGDWSGVRRYLVAKDNNMEKINSPVLMDLGDKDMGDWQQASDFLKWAQTNYPAKKTMFIIWDHGWGWLDPKKPSASHVNGKKQTTMLARQSISKSDNKSISHDFTTGNYIKTTQMSKIFEKTGKVDLYASMACFMQMAEVSYQIKDYADIIVGSEEVIQLPSFNFEDFYRMMLAHPNVTARQAGIFLVDTFKEMYSRPEYSDMLEETKYGVQLSAINGNMMETFGKKLSEWSEIAMKVNDRNAMLKAKKDVLRFEVGDDITDPKKEISFYGDIYDFIRIVNENLDRNINNAKALKSAGIELQNFIIDKLVIKNVFLGKDRTEKDYSNTHGMAIHISGQFGTLIEYEDTYGELEFSKATNWKNFIDYLKKI